MKLKMYLCKECGYWTPVKLWKCPDCSAFWSFDEYKDTGKKLKKHEIATGSVLETGRQDTKNSFFDLQHKELQRVLQNWIKVGGVYLLGGEPGIGKSTIVLQIIQHIQGGCRIGYFSGEENVTQVYDRFKRISADKNDSAHLDVFHSTHFEDIVETTREKKFDMIVIDSIQTIYSVGQDSTAGSPNQVKYCAEKLSEFCKTSWVACLIVGHVTKGGEIAGPKYLEHIVDVVMYLEGDRFGQYRLLKCMKNRFGHTDDVAIFEMSLFGLKPVYDLKERILHAVTSTVPWSVITVGVDNWRAVVVHLEVLLNKTKFKFPQRSAIGIDTQRLNLIVAILEKYLKLDLGGIDIYVNIPWEFSFHDSGLDLAIAAGILSQYKNKILDRHLVFVWELGLGGQITKTKMHEKRLKEFTEDFTLIDYQKIKHIVGIMQFIAS